MVRSRYNAEGIFIQRTSQWKIINRLFCHKFWMMVNLIAIPQSETGFMLLWNLNFVYTGLLPALSSPMVKLCLCYLDRLVKDKTPVLSRPCHRETNHTHSLWSLISELTQESSLTQPKQVLCTKPNRGISNIMSPPFLFQSVGHNHLGYTVSSSQAWRSVVAEVASISVTGTQSQLSGTEYHLAKIGCF